MDPTFQSDLEAIQSGTLSPEERDQRIASARQAIERQREEEERQKQQERFAEDRRKVIAERGIDSSMQRLIDDEPHP